ncbi:aspartate/glutamate racemase family protein [Roseomonas sp. SSH11]|uniref:Aspartate/glutamate racemase family protein n=1 Tax=Pararoseomonas baculiformis TaxID=2820812 RepID=A0ABS4AG79_9PROT|nr:aspartate/glutamate racemase family protein [Pararoseomonas baculiformis]MBP0446011.1 aspartate/glutamate racemase family protein [Pararoseomonas baculiformis]
MERRILVINPNRDRACTAGIAAAVAPFARPGHARFDTIALEEGPPAIASWRDWFSVALPLCAAVQAEAADAYVIACVSDPGIDAVREVTDRPVLGPFRAAVLAAMARADRFGVIAFVEASKARQRRVLLSLGVEGRMAGTEALNLPMTALTDPEAPRAALVRAGRRLVEAGSGAVVLGCAGMAGHQTFLEKELGVPVIEPCAAAAAQALLAIA